LFGYFRILLLILFYQIIVSDGRNRKLRKCSVFAGKPGVEAFLKRKIQKTLQQLKKRKYPTLITNAVIKTH
jgi:hypothetical protein